ncbi:SGNH/GDSL hydrolase family protein [Nocardia inohanensis]|uniref:SGNH/GDSL hydrolase family protein n=1 Tax=Nocardia inohanensis TaxID=209246 RepID=UPI0008319043|nr:SGNH/GDSL hydrolase family protein [Nocardia inohanensis]
MNPDLAAKLVRFQKPELSLPYLYGIDEAHIAALFGLEPEEYRSLREDLENQARAAAADLLTEPEIAEQVDRLPFAPGERVVALGESSTADRLSWFEILRHLLESARPDDRVTFTNTAIAGATTTQILKNSGALRLQRPDWVLCQLGANDAQRLGPDGERVVSAEETARNFELLRAQAPEARWVWLTPTDMDESLIAQFPPFQASRISWRAKDHEETAAVLEMRPEVVIDTLSVTHPTTGRRLFEPDGVHLTPAGQVAVARVVVAELALLD